MPFSAAVAAAPIEPKIEKEREKEMDSRCEEVFSPTGAFNINIAIDVKEREKSEYSQSLHRIRMQSTRALPSKHPNKRKRTPFR